jgi:hypothetical protein
VTCKNQYNPYKDNLLQYNVLQKKNNKLSVKQYKTYGTDITLITNTPLQWHRSLANKLTTKYGVDDKIRGRGRWS